MNVTLQTNNFRPQYKNNNTYQANYGVYSHKNMSANPSFGMKIPGFSSFLKPWNKFVDKSTDMIAKYYTANLYQSPITKLTSKIADKLNGVVDHMQVIGSIIISGMYMNQTLRNDNLEPDKRKTLAVNQGLTFVASTILSYLIDDAIKEKWENLTRKYTVANLELGKHDKLSKQERTALYKQKLKELNKKIADWNDERLKDFNAKVKSGDLAADSKFKVGNVADYVAKKMPESNLSTMLKGMGVLQKLIVFGTIYRFISPVAVTPLANWIGSKYINKPKETEEKTQVAAASTPNMSKTATLAPAKFSDLLNKTPNANNIKS